MPGIIPIEISFLALNSCASGSDRAGAKIVTNDLQNEESALVSTVLAANVVFGVSIVTAQSITRGSISTSKMSPTKMKGFELELGGKRYINKWINTPNVGDRHLIRRMLRDYPPGSKGVSSGERRQ